MQALAQAVRHATALELSGARAAAEEAWRAILASDREDPFARYALSHLLISRGADREGWALYESRLDIPDLKIGRLPPVYPMWRGEPVKSLVVLGEQGLGDQIMFARWVPALAQRGISVTLLVDPALVRLFGSMPAKVVAAAGPVSLGDPDAWCLIGSLPNLVGPVMATPYLPDGEGGGGVGVMPVGSPNRPNGVDRSLPPDLAAELRRIGRDLSPEATGARDFEDTAEIIRNLDVVISVDTSVAHLAGAMGKPTILLLPHRACWRWGAEGERSRWYSSMRIVRQPAPGDWASVVDQGIALIRTMTAAPAAPLSISAPPLPLPPGKPAALVAPHAMPLLGS